MGKGTNTTTTSTGPNPQAAAAYSNLLSQAGGVAATPYQAYQGQLVAPVNAQQQTGIGTINQYATAAVPYLQTAGQLATAAAAPISAQQIQNYENPYTQQVVNATEQQFANTNAQQQQGLLENVAAQGALGGDRSGIAQAVLAGQQQAAQAPVIAGLENTGYNTATQTALAEQQAMAQGAYGLGNVGTSLENAGLTGANAQVGAGTLQQQTQQAADTAAYQQFEQALAYPFQTTQWLAGIDTGVGSQMGGTSQTTQPAPNQTAQYAGLGLGALALLAARGGRIKGYDTGGAPYGGGTPYNDGIGWVPTVSITGGKGAPAPPNSTNQQSGVQNPLQMMTQATQLANAMQSRMGNAPAGNQPMGTAPEAYSPAAPVGVTDSSDFAIYRRGGSVVPFKRRSVPVRAGLGMSSFMRRARGGFADGGAPYDQDYMDQTFAAPIAHSPAMYDIASDPAAMAAYAARASADASPSDLALTAPNYGAGVAYGQANPYVPLPTARPAAADAAGLPPEISGDNSQSNAPSAALGFANESSPMSLGPASSPSAPAAPSPSSMAKAAGTPAGSQAGSGLLGLSPDVKMSLLAAGLGMLSSRSPFLGVGIGEGGLQGLQTYSSLQQQHLAQQKQQQDVDLRVRQLDQQAKSEQDKIALETKQEQFRETGMTPAEKAEIDFRNRAQRLQELQPVKIGTDMATGAEIYGVRDPTAPNGFRRIDPSSMTGTPNGTGAPVSANPAPNAQAAGADQQIPANATPAAGPASPELREEVLQTLDPQLASQVKALDEGRMAFPTGFALKSPYWQNMLRLVSNYDPQFDAVQYNARVRARTDATSGKMAQNNNALNTGIGHLDQLADSVAGLNNVSWSQSANAVKNWITNEFGGVGPSNFESIKNRVAPEIVKIWRGTGGAEADIKRDLDSLSDSKTPAQLYGAISNIAGLMESKIDANKAQYEQAMGTSRLAVPMITPQAQQTLDKLRGLASGTPPSAPRAAAPPVPGAKLYQGKWYTRGPNGEAIPVQ